ncbi:hypothetical protein [Algibacter sp. L1A34]|uniref:hypothetical protein n=1 Tax=Algibacter sp. L1A34 TaxID=2686365 RepID=UPI00131AA09E|nr:hypothetical protein [Algibacter sp. L1A34]
MSINHNLENLTSEQNQNLGLANTLLDNLNTIKPSNLRKSSLKYDGNKFTIVQTGFNHKFLIDDIHLAIKGDYQAHKDFILNSVLKEIDDYNFSDKSMSKYGNMKVMLESIMKYYGFDCSVRYPLYSNNEDFKGFLKTLNISIEKVTLN